MSPFPYPKSLCSKEIAAAPAGPRNIRQGIRLPHGIASTPLYGTSKQSRVDCSSPSYSGMKGWFTGKTASDTSRRQETLPGWIQSLAPQDQDFLLGPRVVQRRSPRGCACGSLPGGRIGEVFPGRYRGTGVGRSGSCAIAPT